MGAGRKLFWFLFGTFAGWVVISLAITFGGVILGAFASLIAALFPFIVLAGTVWLLWRIFIGRNR